MRLSGCHVVSRGTSGGAILPLKAMLSLPHLFPLHRLWPRDELEVFSCSCIPITVISFNQGIYLIQTSIRSVFHKKHNENETRLNLFLL